jgi:hypothetical protein
MILWLASSSSVGSVAGWCGFSVQHCISEEQRLACNFILRSNTDGSIRSYFDKLPLCSRQKQPCVSEWMWLCLNTTTCRQWVWLFFLTSALQYHSWPLPYHVILDLFFLTSALQRFLCFRVSDWPQVLFSFRQLCSAFLPTSNGIDRVGFSLQFSSAQLH